MSNEMLSAALGPGADCPPLEQIDQPQWASHVADCSHCRTELELLHAFEANEMDPQMASQVRQITKRLQARSGEIFPVSERPGFWAELTGFFTMPRLVPVAMGMAALLLVVAVGMQMRRSTAPGLQAGDGPEVMRATQLTVASPIGDQDAVPTRIEWSAVPGAAKYLVRLVEVDGNQLWQGDAAGNRMELPAAARLLIVPAKSILCEVIAQDQNGKTLVKSEQVRFRLRLNPDRQ